MSTGWGALCEVWQQICWFATGVWDALPFGVLFGLVIGPFRISGVDFGKWYRDPGEINEGYDRSWIGAMRTCLLYCARVFWLLLALVAGLAVACVLWGWVVRGRAIGVAALGEQWLRHGPTAGGVLVGVMAAQAAVEVLWQVGLRRKLRQPLAARSRVVRTLAAVAPGPVRQLLTPPRRAKYRPLAKDRDAPRHPWPEPDRPGRRRLVICCDGTWNRPEDGRDTNVVRLARAIKPIGLTPRGEEITQIVRYHLGVGTGNILDRVIGGGAGVGLSGSVRTCYGFLVDNYREGDEILLFGFSRGAYVARSIAGLIGLVGILRKSEMARFEEVWNYYCQLPRTKGDDAKLEKLAPRRHVPVPVRCVGVWDTVGALGIPGSRFCSNSYTFHETGLGEHVRHAFQALALDEQRGNFQPAVWVRTVNDPRQVLEQVWFPGVHTNVGGGYLEHGLADTTMLWMLSRLRYHGLLDVRLADTARSFRQYKAENFAMGRVQDSRSGFWKIAFSPVPRPVGLADAGERIHGSAFVRRCARYGPGTTRRAWLAGQTHRRENPEGLELSPMFRFRGAGTPHVPLIPSRQGWCEWLNIKIFGDQ